MKRNLIYPTLLILISTLGTYFATLYIQKYNADISSFEDEIVITHNSIDIKANEVFKLLANDIYIPYQSDEIEGIIGKNEISARLKEQSIEIEGLEKSLKENNEKVRELTQKQQSTEYSLSIIRHSLGDKKYNSILENDLIPTLSSNEARYIGSNLHRVYNHKYRLNHLNDATYHKFVVDTESTEIKDKIRVEVNEFDQLIMVKGNVIKVFSSKELIEFTLEPRVKVTFFGISRFIFESDKKPLLFSYKNKEINQLNITKYRGYEVAKSLSFWERYPFISIIVDFITLILWVSAFILIPSFLAYNSNIKTRAIMSSDRVLMTNYLVFRHLKNKNPKRFRETIKSIRRYDPIQLDD